MPGKAHVCIIIENMSFTYDTRVQRIASTLSDTGYNVTVICPRYKGDPRRQTIKNIDVRYFSIPRTPDGFLGHIIEYSYAFVAILISTLRVFGRQKFDIVHICNPPDILFPIGYLYRLLGAYFVYDQHDLFPELFAVRYGRSHQQLVTLARLAQKLTLRAANHVIATNDSCRERAMIRGGLNPDEVTVVRNGPKLSDFPRMPPPTPAKLEVVRIGYVGNINPQDGVDLLIQAADYICHTMNRMDIEFVCIGDGSAFQSIRKLAWKLEVDKVVEFVGRTRPQEAWRILASCDICVQPDPKNPFTDSCSMVKSMEYMALGKPIVAFRLTETEKICGNAALYADGNCYRSLGSAILRLADDLPLRRRLGEIGRNRIETTFAWHYSARSLVATYDRLSAGT